MDLQMEVLTDDGETVKAIRVHDMGHEPVPLPLWCDLLQRMSWMTTESVMLVGGGRVERKPPVEKGMAYVLNKDVGGFFTGDYFEGIGDCRLRHCRSSKVLVVDSEDVMADFACVGAFDIKMEQPYLGGKEFLSRIKDMEG